MELVIIYVVGLIAGGLIVHMARKPVRRLIVKRALAKAGAEPDGARAPTLFPDGKVDESVEPELVSMEELERRIHDGQWDSEKNLCDKLIVEEVGALAMAKVLLELHPAGGIKDSDGSIKKNIRQHTARIQRLKQLRFDLEHSENKDPLPLPSDLEIVRQKLAIADGAGPD